MTEYNLPYGTGNVSVSLPPGLKVDVVSPPTVPGADDPYQAVETALENPVGNFNFEDFRSARSVAIAINDKTRPVPHEQLLPPLLKKIAAVGIPRQSVQFWIATGTHVPMRSDEFGSILPADILGGYSVASHDCDELDSLVSVGYTQRGTPILLNRRFYEADLKIVVGNIEPHHFMGFSGGVKTAAIGLAGRQTINQNHALLSHPNTITAHYSDNPMRQEVEEIGVKAGIHLAMNAILNANKQIVTVLAGDPKAVMVAGIPLCQEICQVKIPGAYDLVIASPGGHPKDINFYQSQKGLTHAALMTRDGGAVILAAACPEGVGSQAYLEWMNGITSHAQVFSRFALEGFRVGPHKAYQIAKIASRVHVTLYSQLEPAQVERLLIQPSVDLQASITEQIRHLPPSSKIAILPRAVLTIPVLP